MNPHDASPITIHALTPAKAAAVLAGLRLLQMTGLNPNHMPPGIGDNFCGAEAPPLNEDQIDALCEDLNCAGVGWVVMDDISGGLDLNDGEDGSAGGRARFYWSNETGWGDLGNATHFAGNDLLSLQLPAGIDVRWIRIDDAQDE